MKYLLVLTLIFFFSITSSAAADWITYYNSEGIKIEYRYADCHDETNGIHQQKVFLRFVNLQNKAVEVSYSKGLSFSNSNSATPDVKMFTVMLKPNEIKEGDCANRDNSLFIFSKQLNFTSTELKKFELKDIAVKLIQ